MANGEKLCHLDQNIKINNYSSVRYKLDIDKH